MWLAVPDGPGCFLLPGVYNVLLSSTLWQSNWCSDEAASITSLLFQTVLSEFQTVLAAFCSQTSINVLCGAWTKQPRSLLRCSRLSFQSIVESSSSPLCGLLFQAVLAAFFSQASMNDDVLTSSTLWQSNWCSNEPATITSLLFQTVLSEFQTVLAAFCSQASIDVLCGSQSGA